VARVDCGLCGHGGRGGRGGHAPISAGRIFGKDTLLERLLEAKKADLSSRQYKRYAALLEVPESITIDLKTFTKDPAPIEAYRNRVAKEIERLSKNR